MEVNQNEWFLRTVIVKDTVENSLCFILKNMNSFSITELNRKVSNKKEKEGGFRMAKIRGFQMKNIKNILGIEGYGCSASLYLDGKRIGVNSS